MELISIIVPIYNVEKYLKKCVDSIINQTYKNLEIILVDDGSPDNCGAICDEYAQKDSRVRVIHKENGGLSDARNAGLDIARGNYVSFVDSDDYIDEQMFEIMYNNIIKNDADMTICNYEYVDKNGKTIEELQSESAVKAGCFSPYEILEELCGGESKYYVVACCKLYKINLFADVRFPKGKINEDEFTAHKIFAECKKISCVSEHLYKYVQRDGSIMHGKISIRNLDVIEALIERGYFLLGLKFDILAYNNILKAIGFYKYYFTELKKNKENKAILKKTENMLRKMCAILLIKKIPLRKKPYLCLCAIDIHNDKALRRLLKIRKTKFWKMLSYIKALLKLYNKRCKLYKNIKKARRSGKFCIFLMATPCHGNLGDHAIVYSEYRLLEKCNCDNRIVEISNNYYMQDKKYIKKLVKNKDIIIIDGGGSLGTLWPYEDNKISEIIDTYRNNKIIIFPQTCYYDDTQDGKKRLEKNKEIYKNAKDLTITLREKSSYDFCIKNFDGVKFELVPDLVLSVSKQYDTERKNLCMLCFREDLEKVVSDNDISRISNYLSEKKIGFEKISTVLDKWVFAEQRNTELDLFWRHLSEAKLMLTDRLHGMIFAAITGTPCLALDNASKKVSGVYEWISKLDYIKICENVDEMLKFVPEFYHMTGQLYNTDLLDDEYGKIKELLKK